VEINRKDGDQGYTPLHLATITGNSKIVRRLLIKGADIGIKVRFKREFKRVYKGFCEGQFRENCCGISERT